MQATIKEDLIHYIWKTKRLDYSKLNTTRGEELIIKKWGFHNHHSGPDFSNGQISIDGMTWAGNIEMHVKSSDWHKHGHTSDPAYDNVILHVVWDHDQEILDKNNEAIPTLDLSEYVDATLMDNYHELMLNQYRIPCEKLLSKVDLSHMNLWLNKVLVERISNKSAYLESLLEQTHNDWNQVFFIALCRYLGTKVNAEPMEQLARSFDLSIIWKNKDQLSNIEALLFGQAGMLIDSNGDDYYLSLRNTYQHLSTKYQLQNIDPVAWKFARMRPANFPTIRIAQLAKLFVSHDGIFAKLLAAKNISEINNLLKINPSEYWDNHYRFNKESIFKEKPIGDNLVQIIIINVVVPLLFLYGKKHDDIEYQDKAIALLENVKAENNKITRLWKELGIKADSAYFSQALIQLKINYCDHKKCMTCQVGNMIMR